MTDTRIEITAETRARTRAGNTAGKQAASPGVSRPVCLDDTFAEMMARAGEKGEIPGFSHSSRSILNALTADADNDFDLIQTVLADMALTQRVLRLANSAMYATFGGEVTSVSRAVQVLGVQTIAHLALGLRVIESMERSRPETEATLAEMQKSVLAGFLGRQLAGKDASLKDVEAVAVCSILMGLGRMMVSFYLPEAWARIQAESANEAADGAAHEAAEDAAARAVLGGSFADIGQLMARQWGLPTALTDSLQAHTPLPGEAPATHGDWMRMVATAAAQSARIMHGEPEDLEVALAGVVGSFASALRLEPDEMLGAVRTARKAAREQFQADPAALVRPVTESEKLARLHRGIDELKESAKTATVTQLLILALEFLHANFAAKRSFAFLHFPKETRYRARFGLGEKAASLLPELHFDSKFQPDLFHAILPREKALYIEDAKAGSLKGKLPSWWLASLGTAQSFCVIPLHVKLAPVGFLYLDWAPPLTPPAMDEPHMQIVAKVREMLAESLSKPRV